MNNSDVIISPIITEKGMKASEGGKYSFLTVIQASKTDIKRAVSDLFKVNVLDVQTSILKGRKKRAGKRRVEKIQSSFKKAVVRVKKGQKIGWFEPGGQEPEAQTKIEKKEKTDKEKKKTKKNK